APAPGGPTAPPRATSPYPEEPEVTPARVEVPDAVFRAMRGRIVILSLLGRPPLTGQLVTDDGTSLVLITVPTGEVVAVLRAAVVRIVSRTAPPAAAAAPRAPTPTRRNDPRERRRYFGLQLGLAPSLMLDIEYGYFYAFGAGSLVLPLASQGQVVAGSLGA